MYVHSQLIYLYSHKIIECRCPIESRIAVMVHNKGRGYKALISFVRTRNNNNNQARRASNT